MFDLFYVLTESRERERERERERKREIKKSVSDGHVPIRVG